jgi:hypothetical protein
MTLIFTANTIRISFFSEEQHTHKHTNTHTHTHTYIHTYIQTYIHTYIHTYIYTYIHIYIHTYTHVSVSVNDFQLATSKSLRILQSIMHKIYGFMAFSTNAAVL